MTNYQRGHDAEKVAADYLKKLGFKVTELNWKTPRCEIDIVARKEKTLYFVEVKYRKSGLQGSGLEYITPAKLRQMAYAAETYISMSKWSGEYCLAAIELSGDDFAVTDFIETID